MNAFARIWDTAPAVTIPTAADETDLIAAAAAGDSDAMLRLFHAYRPTLRNAVGYYAQALGIDDARQTAFIGLMDAIRAFDPAAFGDEPGRLAAILRQHVHKALTLAANASTGGFTIPDRTLSRFFGILSKADGDVETAADIAPDHGMTVETFHAVHAAVTAGSSLEAAIEAHGEGVLDTASALNGPTEIADAEDRIMVEIAFKAVNNTERVVCRMGYGFSDYDPIPDAEIGHRLGASRPKVQRTRTAALGKMRSALGAPNV